MADGMVYGIARKIIEELDSWAFREIALLWDVDAELENIMNTVSTIVDVLEDAREQNNHNNQFKDWLEKLNDAVFEADDLFGEFYTKALRRRAMGGNITKKVRDLFSTSSPLVFRQKMSRKIIAMKQKLNAIAEDSKKFHLEEYNVEPSVSMEREETHSFLADEIVIGREDDKRAIIELLLEPNNEENVSIVPIVGIGGLGKTTLAQFVYNDENIQEHFELKMWICISYVFDVKMIIQKIISANGMQPVDHSMDKLQDKLCEIINGKKYLLVLDDVWNEDFCIWERFRVLLLGGAKGSKIVITARARLVAEITRSALIYTLSGLNEEQSWMLFEEIAFRNGQGQGTNNPRLEEIGREIVHECQGVPLAIKSIGKVLCLEEAEHKWLYVKDNILEIASQQKNDFFPILKLSYDHLPSRVKNCFAFCSLLPKDCKIDCEELIKLWIAQGFIQSSNEDEYGDRELENVGLEYFDDLLLRSMFEYVTGEYGKFKMPGLIHYLAQFVAGAECTQTSLDGNNFDEKTCHVSLPFKIDSSFIETSGLLVRAGKLRTCLLTFETNGLKIAGNLEKSMLNKLILSCRRLRALGLCGVQIERVPDSIGKLIHLTYLDFSENHGIKTLPNAISRLLRLQTLKVNDCRNLKELPRDIRFLVGLRHLENSYCGRLSHMPDGLGQMTCLQTLSLFVVRDNQASTSGPIGSGLDELNSLNSLIGALEISNFRCLEDVNSEPKAANLGAKQYLDRLTLLWHANDRYFCSDDNNDGDEKLLEGLKPHEYLKFLSVNGYGGVRFPSWLSFVPYLTELSIYGCKRCRQLPRLSHLWYLERLSLHGMEVLEYISDDSDGDINEEERFFHSLKSISIRNCPNLKGWWRSPSTTDPHHWSPVFRYYFSKLDIEFCPNLTSLPPFRNLEESLFLWKVSLKALQPTIAMTSWLPFSELKSLALISIVDTEALPDNWMSNLSSLRELRIEGDPKLKSLSLAVRNLTSLESLKIGNCELFDSISFMDDDGIEWQHLKCLSSACYENVPNLKSIPSGLQHVTALRKLEIYNCPNLTIFPVLTSVVYLNISRCPNLTSFPDGISNLTSLEELYIFNCPSLISLPDEMLSLQKLRIERCPALAKRCEKGIGEDWFKIAHVPVIEILKW